MKEQLINKLIENRDKLPYVNLSDDNKYLGWTSDFKLRFEDGSKMYLNLAEENDLFLLFVLASSWSKTGAWENAAYFATYLKQLNKDITQWEDNNFIESEIENRNINAALIVSTTTGITPRKKVSFRKDYYSSVAILAKNWDSIKRSLRESEEQSDYNIFINYISALEGLGSGVNKMRIKILLILRELRCQNAYKNIPGELCCIPDNRAKDTATKLGINLPNNSSMKTIIKASQIIYENFGDLYDIPLFAYEDLFEENINKEENQKKIKSYNKLVRDLIPEVIHSTGKQCDTVIAPQEDRGPLLEAKLNEEVNEYLQDKNLEELADIMEVLFGLAHNLGYSEEDLLNKREEKLKERGGFKKGIVLKMVFI